MTSRGSLYATTAGAWNRGVPYLEHGSALAFVEISRGRYICRPRFDNAWSETAWRSVTGAVELSDADLSDELRARADANNL